MLAVLADLVLTAVWGYSFVPAKDAVAQLFTQAGFFTIDLGALSVGGALQQAGAPLLARTSFDCHRSDDAPRLDRRTVAGGAFEL